MKPRHFLPPVLAVAVVGAGLGYQWHSASTLERESVELREAIHSAREGRQDLAGGEAAGTRPLRPEEAMLAGKIDWKQVAAKMKEADGDDSGGIRFMLAMQKRLSEMSVDELGAALDEIAAAGLEERERNTLETHLLSLMAKQHPRLALEHFQESLNERNSAKSWLLSRAFKQWAGEDPTAAAEWLDRQVTAGNFESKELKGDSDTLRQFETGLILSLLSADPQAAARRVAALPADERAALLRGAGGLNLKPGMENAYADLVRRSLPESEQASALASGVQELASSEEGFGRVDQYLAGIGASGKERGLIAEMAVLGRLSGSEVRANFAEELDAARNWAAGKISGSVNELTGRAIGAYAYADPDRALKLAIQYQENGGGDDVIVAFLKAGGGRSGGQSMKLLERVADETRREEVRSTLERNFGARPR